MKIRSIESVAQELHEADQFNLKDLDIGKKVEFITENNTYTIERRDDGLYISGNPKYCPEPTKAYIAGSTLGGSAILVDRIAIGGYLEFTLPDRAGPIHTSRIQEFTEID